MIWYCNRIPMSICGDRATRSRKITVRTSWDNKNYTTTSASDGTWKIQVQTPSAGGPYTITISDGEPVTLTNVLIGEVWLCSGQSNMEMPVKGFRDNRWRAHVMLLQQLSHPIIFV